MKVLLFVIMFLLFGAFFIISNEQLALKDSAARTTFVEHYYAWLSTLFDRGKVITGFVVHSDWLPGKSFENRTETTDFVHG